VIRVTVRHTSVKVRRKLAEVKVIVKGVCLVSIHMPNDTPRDSRIQVRVGQEIVKRSHFGIEHVAVRVGSFQVHVASSLDCCNRLFVGVGVQVTENANGPARGVHRQPLSQLIGGIHTNSVACDQGF
jgi:hypothetical protein